MAGIPTARRATRRPARPRPPARPMMVAWVLLAGGVLVATTIDPGTARADRIDDALRCLDERAALVERRAGLMREAEELGRRIEAAEREDRGAAKSLRRQADRLQRLAFDLELALLATGQSCRAQAEGALPACAERLRVLEAALETGGAGPGEARELLRWREVKARLQAAISDPAGMGDPLLPPDSTDTQETLRAKLQYHEEVCDRLRGLARRVERRRREVEEERRALVEASRFLEDLRFLDEGGRVSAGGDARFRGLPGAPGEPGGIVPRTVGGADTAGGGGSLERVLDWNPVTPEESDQLLRALDAYRSTILGELEAFEKMRNEVLSRILPDLPAGP